MNPLSIDDMAEISRLVGNLSTVEISRRIGKDYFTVRQACRRIKAGLSCQIEWHPCSECDKLISNPKCKTHPSCIRARNARWGREKRKLPHVKSTEYVRQYRADHPEKKHEAEEKYKALLRSRWPNLPQTVKDVILDQVHQADLRDQEITQELASNSRSYWTVDEDVTVIETLKIPAREVALKLGRSLWSIKGRRQTLRRRGIIE